MYESNLATTTRRAERHARERMLLQFAVAAWVTLIALGFVLLL
jgi:hypothetical protein